MLGALDGAVGVRAKRLGDQPEWKIVLIPIGVGLEAGAPTHHHPAGDDPGRSP
jgi:hypothetical protein